MKIMRPGVLSVSLFVLVSSVAVADVAATMDHCDDCHGDNGVSQWTDVPTIGGVAEFVHSDALYIYRDKERPCADSAYRQGDTSRPETNMCAIAADMSDDDIEAIAAAYAEKPYVKAKQEFDAALATAGQAIHEEHCDRCHSDGGTNVDDEAGMLGGQMMGYLETAFAEYASGDREQPNKMKAKLDPLSGDDIKALVQYYASQQ
jgi:sulfide dehydrogenase cytochrome subunit